MVLCPPLAQSRHRRVHRTCLLLNRKWHRAPRLVASTSASYTFRCSVGFGGRSMNFRAIGALGVSFGLALCGGLISRAEAVPVSYVFSSDASVLFSDGHLETISGAFTVVSIRLHARWRTNHIGWARTGERSLRPFFVFRQ